MKQKSVTMWAILKDGKPIYARNRISDVWKFVQNRFGYATTKEAKEAGCYRAVKGKFVWEEK